jgi:hypothetical protein
MAAIPTNTLLGEVQCYACFGGSIPQLLELALLRRKLLAITPTADVSAGALLEYSKCYACYGASIMQLLKLALLDQIANPTSAGLVESGLALISQAGSSATVITPTFQPTANALVLAFVSNGAVGGVAVTSIAGNGLTWVKVNNTTGGGTGAANMEVWRAMGAAPTSGAATVTFAGAVTNAIVRVVQVTGADTSGTNGSGAIVQSGVANSVGATNPTVNLAALSATGRNGVFGAVNSNVSGSVPEAGWSKDFDTSIATSISVMVYQLRSTDNTVVITQASAQYAMVAFEVKASA